MNMVEQFIAARRAAAPLILIETPDPAAAMAAIAGVFPPDGPMVPIVRWDIQKGVTPYNEAGKAAVAAMVAPYPDASMLTSPSEVLNAALAMPGERRNGANQLESPGSILFYLNAHRYFENESVSQGWWNARDAFKANRRTIVGFAPKGASLPPELQSDVVVISEPLPTAEEAKAIILRQYENARRTVPSLEVPEDAVLDAYVNEVLGLSAFSAEQTTAMSLTRNGMNVELLRARKRQQIALTPGLSEYVGPETFDGVGGCDRVKFFLRSLFSGERPPRAIVFIDEIEKLFAGVGGDTSGTSSDQLGAFLSWTQAVKATGNIFVGVPGGAKSAIAKATSNEFDTRVIQMDLGAMKSSFVGSSETRFRTALSVCEAVSQGDLHMIVTSNKIRALPPELKRRFRFGTFMFDLPTAAERALIWKIYLRKFALPEQPLPADVGWTGSEIEACAEMAWRMRMPLTEAASFITPVAVTGKADIEALRREAENNYLSASFSGTYRIPTEAAVVGGERSIELEVV